MVQFYQVDLMIHHPISCNNCEKHHFIIYGEVRKENLWLSLHGHMVVPPHVACAPRVL